MRIKCIVFDLDDTLWECHPVIVRAEQHFYDWLNSYYPKITQRYNASELVEHRIKYMQAQDDNLHDLTILRKNWMEELAVEVGYDNSYVDAGFEVFWLARNEVTFFERTLEILEDLARRYSLGVISNGNADVNHIGVGHLFEFSLSSEQAGVSKPNKAIFDQALALAGTKAQDTVYVGDNPKNDILGAHGAGWHAIWFNPRLQAWPGGRTPTAVIRHLSDLEEKIKRL
jgi:putative hydrolase of the HAD superfamily